MLDRLEPDTVMICQALKTVGAMHHNKPLLRNSFGWLRNRVRDAVCVYAWCKSRMDRTYHHAYPFWSNMGTSHSLSPSL